MKHIYTYVLSTALAFIAITPLAAGSSPAKSTVIAVEIGCAGITADAVLGSAETQLTADPRKKFKKQKRRTPVDRKRKMKNGKNCPSF
jgi:hypothetical protein